jgi:hypothetical protein
MKGYPAKLKIGDRTYRIRFVKLIRNDKSVLGLFDPNRIEILIKKDQSHDETLKTMLHEICHGFQYEYDINTTHKSVYQMEEALFDFICANSEALSK